jgi:transposase InsO family protein
MDQKVRQRLKWVQMYEATGNAGKTCLRCGISRPTLRKWYQRYKKNGLAGLEEQSRRPHKLSGKKVTKEYEDLILDLRSDQNLGARRIQGELIWRHNFKLSLATIHKILKRHEVPPLVRIKRKIGHKRYERPIPGDRVQMDTMKVKPGLYQYTAVDDCSRFIVAAVYTRRTAGNTLLFLEKVCEELPFPVQRIQTDRGREFFAHKVQKRMMDWAIKFRPVKPRSPHLNGKVERAQKTFLAEFYPSVDLDDPNLQDRVDEWVFHYNWLRGHGSLGGKAPVDRVSALSDKTPILEDVGSDYDPSKERMRDPNYALDLKLGELKRSL